MACPFCKMEKTWLEQNNIKHDISYVDTDQSEAIEMVRKTGQMGVPVTEVLFEDSSSEMIIGFDVPKLSKALDIGN
ncbi:MAG: hypothetical protein GYA60_09385 [Candidatus Methanofastidiosa archaeon]|nr:hypothetical protein [Candidatus Methanofastidiosa archaeon]